MKSKIGVGRMITEVDSKKLVKLLAEVGNLLDAVNDLSNSESDEGCSEDLTVVGKKEFHKVRLQAKKIRKMVE